MVKEFSHLVLLANKNSGNSSNNVWLLDSSVLHNLLVGYTKISFCCLGFYFKIGDVHVCAGYSDIFLVFDHFLRFDVRMQT